MNCRDCQIELTDENWYPTSKKRGDYLCKKCLIQRSNDYHQSNRMKRLGQMKDNYRADQLRYSARMRRYYVKAKVEALRHYSNKPYPACVRCGMVDIRCLSIDHINGGGTRLRAIEGAGGIHLYRYLRKHEWPTGYQTLCLNCQFIKRWENKEVKTSSFRKTNGGQSIAGRVVITL